jgi:hypothetical protein
MRDLADIHYPDTDRIRVVMDNLSTHTAGALYEAFPAPEAQRVLQRNHLSDRVRAHVLLCMLAYYLEWHMRQALAPILFDDHQRAEAAAARSSIVAPAQRSKAAHRKAATKRTADGLPVHSFQSLLAELATFTRNTMAMAAAPHDTFLLYPQPTPTQLRAFELLAVQPRL